MSGLAANQKNAEYLKTAKDGSSKAFWESSKTTQFNNLLYNLSGEISCKVVIEILMRFLKIFNEENLK